MGLGFILGPLIGGWAGAYNLLLPFWIAVGLTGLAAILSLTMFQETLSPAARRPFILRQANAFAIFARMRTNPLIAPFLIALLIFSFGETIYETIWSYWGTQAFGWNIQDIGNTLVVFGLGMALVQGGLSGPLITRFGPLPVAIFSMGLSCLGLVFMVFVSATWMVYALMPLMWVTGLSMPALQTYLSERTDDSHQGELQGILASMGSLAFNYFRGLWLQQPMARHLRYGAYFLSWGALCHRFYFLHWGMGYAFQATILSCALPPDDSPFPYGATQPISNPCAS